MLKLATKPTKTKSQLKTNNKAQSITKRKIATRKTARKFKSPKKTQSTVTFSTSASQGDVVKLRQDTPYDFGLHEKRWNTTWNIAQPSKYSNPDEYTPDVQATDPTALKQSDRPSFYSLSMFPYPSGDLHMGHVRVYTISDCLSRYYTAKGFNVIHPMGWDAFGLPAENAARDRGISPATWTYSNLQHMRKQLNALGMKFDWGREVATCSADYYKWTQWIFTTLFRMGLAYRKKAVVNWDPIDETVLANEQVDAEGKSWRSGAVVERKELAQWFFKITDYAEELLQGLDTLDQWPSTVKLMQSQWIGKKNSAHIDFDLTTNILTKLNNDTDIQDKVFTAFTTRPDTLMGVTYVAVLPGHDNFSNYLRKMKAKIESGVELFTSTQEPITMDWINKSLEFATGYDQRKAEFNSGQRVITSKHRGTAQQKQGADEATVITTGFKTPIEFTHPISGDSIPVYMADYVEKGRGTGVVMGVPAHDFNDFAFAKQHKIPVKVVINPNNEKNSRARQNDANIDENGIVIDPTEYTPHVTQAGSVINSTKKLKTSSTPVEDDGDENFDNLDPATAATAIIKALTKKNKGKSAPSYQLHDWLVSRQRYWGTPIPIIYCNDGCGPQPVPEADLPVALPEGIPLDIKGRSPLASSHPVAEKWRNEVSCPCCGSENAERETDTLDTFIDSSWYFLRFLSSETHRHNEKITDHITAQAKFKEISKEVNKKNKKVLAQLEQIHSDENNTNSIGLSPFQKALDEENKQSPQVPWNLKELGELYPVTQYIGGIEHAILHLLYSRFISYALFDANLVTAKEPFQSLLTQGMVHGESFKHPITNGFITRQNVLIENDKGVVKAFQKIVNDATQEVTKGDELNVVWEKMSKSKGNGVNPDDMVLKYGADVCRMFMLFKAPPEKVLDWDEQSVQGMSRWVNRLNILTNGFVEGVKADVQKKGVKKLVNYNNNNEVFSTMSKSQAQSLLSQSNYTMTPAEEALMSTTAVAVHDVTKAMEQRQFNVAIAKMMTLSNELFDFVNDTTQATSVEWAMSTEKLNSPAFTEALTTLMRLLHPIAPHFTAESFVRMQNATSGVDYQPQALSDAPLNGDTVATHDISALGWPSFDMSWAEQKATATIQLNGKLLFTMETAREILDKPDNQLLSELCKLDQFKTALLPKIPKGKSDVLDALIQNNQFSTAEADLLATGFKRVVAKGSPKVNKFLINFVL